MSMRIIYPSSPNQALYEGLHHLHRFGVESPSRNGSVIVSPSPVMTIYADPSSRVLVGPTRDANPFFHIVEAFWMLAGRNDAKLPASFAKNIANYSDDGVTLNGAYGYRWRQHFGYDQLAVIIEQLRHDPNSRRAVLQMWDANFGEDEVVFGDLERAARGSLDVPCNTAIYFDTLGGRLNMTVTCRSNDIVWGAYGANVVHMSILLEYMATATGIPMGEYRQFSNNYHAYTGLLPKAEFQEYADKVLREDIYTEGGPYYNRTPKLGGVYTIPLDGGEGMGALDAGINGAMSMLDEGACPDITLSDSVNTTFFRKVSWPMMTVHRYFKSVELRAALEACNAISADDWRAACQAWIVKRMAGQS